MGKHANRLLPGGKRLQFALVKMKILSVLQVL